MGQLLGAGGGAFDRRRVRRSRRALNRIATRIRIAVPLTMIVEIALISGVTPKRMRE